ncbi:hypothetical protein PAHAL_7G168500 [Panicum hallii]|uniref:Peptidase A1 domain-containing protein n=1 Tax=Panicum hallii TaxID=206008 RepID=A0A2T8ICH7_9POAL|nr:aspartyl protease 37-like [Panicum hallii]PVH35391.1 hypothetical protein PAHAL_7G168500 [Panicum hallii]
MELLLVLLLLLFLALPVLPAPVRLELARVDANLTGHDLIRRAVQRSLDRPGVVVARPSGGGGSGAATAADGGRRSAAAAEAPVVAGGGEYLVKLGIGTPQHFFSAAIDTATDLVWMQCQPCVSCYRQLDPVFNPRLSSSYAVVPCRSDTCGQLDEHRCRSEDDDACQYTYRYSGNGVTRGTLAIDKLAVGSDVFHGVIFGCSNSSAGGPPAQASGLVGLGRGPLSLVSQLSVRRFMYCLPPPMSRVPGKLVLGAAVDAVQNVSDRVTITMSSSTRYPSYYYLNLDGLAVGDQTPRTVRTAAPPPTARRGAATGGGSANAYGMIVDIASTISFLEASLYDELADDLEEELRLPRATPSRRLGLDLCFILPEGVGMDRVYVPTVSLSFDGRWLELERDQLFVEDGRTMCLMVGKTSGVSILGNFQQQNMQVLYNLRRGKITFAKASCESMP